MNYSINFVVHMHALQQCLARFGGRASFSEDLGKLEVRAKGRSVQWHAQFGHEKDNSFSYSQMLTAQSEAFVGWRPYVNRVWPLSVDKRAFKEFCTANGLPTPRRFLRAEEVSADVLVKRSMSSFGQGITGPFTPATVKSAGRALANGEFFEEFIDGESVKIWYWNDEPVCLEKLPLPRVEGDGRRTLRQLINRAKFPGAPAEWSIWEIIAAWQGLTLDSVVAAGRKVLVEFRYRSSLHPFGFENLNCLSSYAGTPAMSLLREAGRAFGKQIPESIRQNTLYTADAMADASGAFHFLELNCNPVAHPDTYLPMFTSLFGEGAATRDLEPPKLKIAAAG